LGPVGYLGSSGGAPIEVIGFIFCRLIHIRTKVLRCNFGVNGPFRGAVGTIFPLMPVIVSVMYEYGN
jgi:hypothetical protein